MKKLIIALVIVVPMLLVTSCVTTETVYYTRAYPTRTVYTVGNYGGPYWNDAYYYGYDDLGDVGYWGMYDSYNVY
ncbi:MAG: hypothetical protein LEGION0403_FIIPPAGN_02236 [Legionella sp.]|uniref:hypothetical protein n=1 Tax=Legionella sp. TaxID=459 RepID=UPI003D10F7D7